MNSPITILPVTHQPDFGGRPHRIKLDQTVAVKGYGKLILRPIRLDDEDEMLTFHQGISEESIYLRYFEYLGLDSRTAHHRLVRICTNTPESYAIVAEKPASVRRPAEILAVGRLSLGDKPGVASFDTLLVDEAQTTHLAKILLKRLAQLARAFGFEVLTRELLVADHDGQNLCRELGFTMESLPNDGLVRATLNL